MSRPAPATRALWIVLGLVALGAVGARFAFEGDDADVNPARAARGARSTDTAPDDSAALPTSEGVAPTRVGAATSAPERPPPRAPGTILRVVGSVRDARTGEPVGDLEIVALGIGRAFVDDGSARARATCDATGRFDLEVLLSHAIGVDPAGWRVTIAASGERIGRVARDLRAADFAPDPAHASELRATCDLQVAILLAVRGRIVARVDGAPIAGAHAVLLERVAGTLVPRGVASANADAEGRFLLQSSASLAGESSILGVAQGWMPAEVSLALERTRVVDVGDVGLSEGACIEGLVVTPDGSKPVSREVLAQARTSGDTTLSLPGSIGGISWDAGRFTPRDVRAPIGTDGRFRVCGLPAGDVTLSLDYLGCSSGTRLEYLIVRAPATGVRLAVARAVYRLRALDSETGSDVADAQLVLTRPTALRCPIARDYVVVLDPGAASEGRIVAPGHRALACTLPALQAGEARDLEFRLERRPPGVACVLVVTSPTGAPVEHVIVRLHSDDPDSDDLARAAAQPSAPEPGRFELPELPAGPYRLEVDPNWHAHPDAAYWLGAVRDVELRSGADPIRVRFEEGGLVQASVRSASRGAVEARTSLVRDGAPTLVDWRDDRGTFAGWIPKARDLRLAQPLPAGRWTLRFEADGCVARDVAVDVEIGVTRTIEVVLEPEAPR